MSLTKIQSISAQVPHIHYESLEVEKNEECWHDVHLAYKKPAVYLYLRGMSPLSAKGWDPIARLSGNSEN